MCIHIYGGVREGMNEIGVEGGGETKESPGKRRLKMRREPGGAGGGGGGGTYRWERTRMMDAEREGVSAPPIEGVITPYRGCVSTSIGCVSVPV